MVIALFPSERNLLKEDRCPLVMVYGKHIEVDVIPEVRFNHFQLFVWWKVRNVMGGKELLYREVYKI